MFTKQPPGHLENHRHWAKHYQAMVSGIKWQLMLDECSTTSDDTAALRRVLKMFEEGAAHHLAEVEADV